MGARGTRSLARRSRCPIGVRLSAAGSSPTKIGIRKRLELRARGDRPTQEPMSTCAASRTPMCCPWTIRHPIAGKAAAIANAFAEAYLTEQLEAKYDATRRAAGWLQTRIAELKQKFAGRRLCHPEIQGR